MPTLRLSSTQYHDASLPPSPATPALLFVGQQPGHHEDLHGQPFVGPSGVYLRGGYLTKGRNPEPHLQRPPNLSLAVHFPGPMLDGNPIRSHATIYVSNIARCKSPDNKFRAEYMKPCLPYLTHDLHTILQTHRRVGVVCLGEHASTTLLKHWCDTRAKQAAAFKLSGHTYSLSINAIAPNRAVASPSGPYTITVFHAYHPAAVLRDGNKAFAIDRSLHLVCAWLQNVLPPITSPRIIPPCPPPPPKSVGVGPSRRPPSPSSATSRATARCGPSHSLQSRRSTSVSSASTSEA